MWQCLLKLQLPLKSVLWVVLATPEASGIMLAQYTVTWKTLLFKLGLLRWEGNLYQGVGR